MNLLSPQHILSTPAGELAALDSEALFRLKSDAADFLEAAKTIVEHVDHALDLRYSERAHQLRLAADKDTGIVHFDDGDVRISADLPKKIEWDQTLLAEIAKRITAGGDNPADYIDISYRVAESRFNAWPDTLKTVFNAARTLKTGKPRFRLALLREGSA